MAQTAARRRLARQKQDEDIYKLVNSMVENVLPCTDDQLSPNYIAKRERYLKLKDAFHTHDVPTDGTLDLRQFVAARRAVGYGGTDEDLEAQFRAVDTDQSGAVDINEFIVSDMGKKAAKVGSLGYVKILNKLVGTAADRWKSGGSMKEAQSPSNQRNVTKLSARKMVQRMTGFGGLDQKKLESWGIRGDRRAHSITAGMLEHILHD